MSEESKTTLFYIFALAALVIGSILFTGRIEPLAEESPAPAAPTFAKVETALSLPATDRKACPITTQKTALYRIETSGLVDQQLVISGTVYASDFMTPLPDVLIEIWHAPAEISPDPPEALHYTFYGRVRTDAAGHYETTVLLPGQGNMLPLYYRVRYQNRCPLGQQLLLVDEQSGLTDSALIYTLAKLGIAQGEPAGPWLRGPVDIVLPVPLPFPLPAASGSAVGAPRPGGVTWGPSYYADDTNLEAERDRPELEYLKRIDPKTLRGGAEGPSYRQL